MRRWWLAALLGCGCGTEKITEQPATEADADTDTDADADTDTDLPPPPVTLLNFPENCANAAALSPGPGESNHIAAALLDPTYWPYRVDNVRVVLANEPQNESTCDAGKAHTVFVWVIPADEDDPPRETPPDQILEFPETTVEDVARLLAADLSPPITLVDGERLAVGLQFAGTVPDTSCVATCRAQYTPDVDFWSNASEPPYFWSFLFDFGIQSNLWIFAEGEALTE